MAGAAPAPAPLPAGESAPPLPPLPAPGGPARAVLMLVHPRLLFLYWVLDTALENTLRRHRGPAELRMEISRQGRPFSEVARHGFDFRASSWYLPNGALDCLLRARLGLGSGASFREVLVSNPLRIPRDRAGAEAGRWAAAGAARRSPAPANPAHAFSPGSGPGWISGPRGRTAGASGGGSPGASEHGGTAAGDLCFVLHSHLPFVRHPERDYFLEEHWLFEAITETYLPLLDMLEHLQEEEIPARLTLSLTPTLMAMLRDPLLVRKYGRHLERMCELATREVNRTRSDPDFGPVAGFYRDRLERCRHLFQRACGGDLVGAFADLEAQGRIEIITCAATHALLPNLAVQPECVRAQIRSGVEEHRRQIGRSPRGLWLPECAYFEGLDGLLADAGIEYFFVDSHAVRNASSPPRYDLHAPLVCPSGTAAFARDEECSAQVWSAQHGYPGDPDYRDFYRDIGYDLAHDYVGPYLDPSGKRGMTGFKYHRITGRHDNKEPYRRERALRTLARHADDFVANRRAQCRHLASRLDRRPLLVAMYDSELFGHWWFEGPEWLEAVLRRLPAAGLCPTSPSRYLDENPSNQAAEPSTSSWGENGYFQVWIGESNDWILPPLHDAGRRMVELANRPAGADPMRRRILTQAGRELLLAQSSDWPFILKNRTSTEYATRRARQHLARFDALARQIEGGPLDEAGLAAIEAQDNLFPELDPRVWRST